MNDKRNILDRFKDYDDRLLVNNLLEAAETCESDYTVKSTVFLDPRQQGIAKDILSRIQGISYMLEGGIENSERKLCIISHEDLPCKKDGIDIIRLSWFHTGKSLSHRDVLGSLIGNGIKREMIGDIILDDSTAFFACKSEISNFILLNISRIGSVPVKVTLETESIARNDSVKQVSSTVASLRLDCILAAAFGISRSKALECIRANRVRINWEETDTASREVKQGDNISLRGKGRIVLEEVAGNTKKDRIRVMIKKYK